MSHESRETADVGLSVAMIVRDEQQVLADTLESLNGLANEIVVADTGSSDDSTQIARGHGARVIETTWSDDFSAARNAALAATRGRWVLWLDAGETLPKETAEWLREFVDSGPDATRACQLFVEVPPAISGAAPEQIAQVRLMPRLESPVFSGRVRETPRAALLAAGLEIESTRWRIVRHRRDHDPEVKAARARRNLELSRLEIEQHGLSPAMLTTRGEAFMALGERQQAAAAFYQALRLSRRGSTDMLEAYYGLLTTFAGDATDRDQQLAICLEALEVFPLDAQLLCAMGNYLQAQDRLDLAARSFQAATEHGAVEPDVWHLRGIRASAAACLSLICQLQGDHQRAESVLQSALERQGDAPQLRRHLIHLSIKRGRTEEALEELERLPAETPHREALRSAVRGACLVAQQNAIPALAYLETAYSAGCRDPLCLKWLFVALVSAGREGEAEAILREWEEVEPAHPEIAQYRAAFSAAASAELDDVPATPLDEDAVQVDSTASDPQGPAKIRIDKADHRRTSSAPTQKSTAQSPASARP